MRKFQEIPVISAVENHQNLEDGLPSQVKLLTSFFFITENTKGVGLALEVNKMRTTNDHVSRQ